MLDEQGTQRLLRFTTSAMECCLEKLQQVGLAGAQQGIKAQAKTPIYDVKVPVLKQQGLQFRSIQNSSCRGKLWHAAGPITHNCRSCSALGGIHCSAALKCQVHIRLKQLVHRQVQRQRRRGADGRMGQISQSPTRPYY